MPCIQLLGRQTHLHQLTAEGFTCQVVRLHTMLLRPKHHPSSYLRLPTPAFLWAVIGTKCPKCREVMLLYNKWQLVSCWRTQLFVVMTKPGQGRLPWTRDNTCPLTLSLQFRDLILWASRLTVEIGAAGFTSVPIHTEILDTSQGLKSSSRPINWSQHNLPLSGSGTVYCFFLFEVDAEESLRGVLTGASLCWAFLCCTICSSFFSLSCEREMKWGLWISSAS